MRIGPTRTGNMQARFAAEPLRNAKKPKPFNTASAFLFVLAGVDDGRRANHAPIACREARIDVMLKSRT
ncbi:hypothetical protein [Paraburkholderia sp. PGU19]|uniref:hypothetical protein n=1 Tax=Paraburkholderia sp. PGU19 TaxID=2735434 RepID=UPI0015DA3BE7|nr:hypothetical protein [Paraburkholderia sp. PGU19]